MVKNKTSITLRIDDTLYLKLKVIAKRTRRSWNNSVECAVAEYIEKYEQQYGAIPLKNLEEEQ